MTPPSSPSTTPPTANGPAAGAGPKATSPPAGQFPLHVELALYALLANFWFWRRGLLAVTWGDLPYLPFFPWLDALPAVLTGSVLVFVYLAATAGIVLRIRPGWCAVALGVAIISVVVLSRPLYSTNLLFHGCLFVLIGLYRGDDRPLRWQLALLYCAAGLNKALLSDWWDGQYMLAFAREFGTDRTPVLTWVEQSPSLAAFFGAATVVTELVLLPALFLYRPALRYGVAVGLLFHGGMLLLTAGQLSPVYLYLAAAAYLALTPLPDRAAGWRRYTSPGALGALVFFALLLAWLHRRSLLALLT